jgi:hypothetical protein
MSHLKSVLRFIVKVGKTCGIPRKHKQIVCYTLRLLTFLFKNCVCLDDGRLRPKHVAVGYKYDACALHAGIRKATTTHPEYVTPIAFILSSGRAGIAQSV